MYDLPIELFVLQTRQALLRSGAIENTIRRLNAIVGQQGCVISGIEKDPAGYRANVIVERYITDGPVKRQNALSLRGLYNHEIDLLMTTLASELPKAEHPAEESQESPASDEAS